MNIKITEVPPGSTPIQLREELVGVILPVATDGDEIKHDSEDRDGYHVETEKVIEALSKAGKNEAADFCEYIKGSIGSFFFFNKDCCIEVS